jgi:glycosyltransferase involved in cell wall biosynthesis
VSQDKNLSKELCKTRKEFDGFTYYNFPYPKGNKAWLRYKKVYRKLIGFLHSEGHINDLELVIYYGSPSLSLFNTKLIRYCKTHKIRVVTDCVDWLSTRTNNLLFDIVKWADNTYQKSYANRKVDGVIAISSSLANYYQQRGCLSVIIPPLSPEEYGGLGSNRETNDKIVITYAGVPFRMGHAIKDCSILKDRIDKTIIFLHDAKQKGCNFVLNIYGFTREEYLRVIPSQKQYIEELETSIVFHGQTPNEYVVNKVASSDFTILIRDMKISTMAGFPTKVSESISCGTPVITTRTSDLSDYIEEGKNGFFLDFEDETAKKQLIKILLTDRNSVLKMKKYCSENNPFYYMKYVNKISVFLDMLN